MFSGVDKDFRAGIVFNINGEKYAYSLNCFMRFFVAHAESQARDSVKLESKTTIINSLELLWRASQSITGEGNKDKNKSLNDISTFIINDREITCPNNQDAYVFDMALSAQYEVFKEKRISYLQMARFLFDSKKIDAQIANKIFNIIDDDGEYVNDEDLEVLSILIATLFIAEPSRNPSCFVPTLMLLELIAHECKSPFGTPYTFMNSLQNEQLVIQKSVNLDSALAVMHGVVFPRLVGVPSIVSLFENIVISLDENQKELYNGIEEYNQQADQDSIKTSEFLMQIGGYFPGSHRYSYSELKYKRENQIPTLSDIKSFIIISDWLKYKLGQDVELIHTNYLHENHHPSLDLHKMALMETIIPAIYDSCFKNQALDLSSLNVNPSTNSYYPQLLTRFGCRQSKLSDGKLANTFFLLHGSSTYGPEVVKEVKKQFTCWSIATGHPNNIKDAEEIVRNTYKL